VTAPARIRPTDWKNPDYDPIYAKRLEKLRGVRADGEEGWNALIGYYQTADPSEFIEDWLVTYDPRAIPAGRDAYMPFVLFERQREFITWLHAKFEGRESALVEKSRDMGVSWLCCAYALYLWLFRPGVAIGFGSQKLENVDKLGVPKSLLEKIRIMIRMLPAELKPIGWNDREHATYMRIVNPETGAIITGDGGEKIGRGDRTSIYFVDEAAFLEQPDAVEGSLSNTTDIRIDVSTPNGEGNPFYRRRMGGAVPVFTFHWTADPRKDDAWYEKMKREYDPITVAREIDLDYGASGGESVIESKWVLASKLLRAHLEKTGELRAWLKAQGKLRRVAGLDVGGGTAPSVFVPRQGPVVGKSAAWLDGDTTDTAGRALELMSEQRCTILKFDTIGVGKGVASSLLKFGGGARSWAINTGNKPTHRTWPDGKTSYVKFLNLRAEMWWAARERMRKTYEHWLWVQGKGGRQYDLGDLLLMPDDPKICGQISLPRFKFTDAGKIQIERKEQMATRGVPSPDYADAVVLTLAPRPAKARSGRTKGMS
jgi:phage terminase large subunit